MLCLGPKKSLTSPRLELTRAQCTDVQKSSVKTTRLSRRPINLLLLKISMLKCIRIGKILVLLKEMFIEIQKTRFCKNNVTLWPKMQPKKLYLDSDVYQNSPKSHQIFGLQGCRCSSWIHLRLPSCRLGIESQAYHFKFEY